MKCDRQMQVRETKELTGTSGASGRAGADVNDLGTIAFNDWPTSLYNSVAYSEVMRNRRIAAQTRNRFFCEHVLRLSPQYSQRMGLIVMTQARADFRHKSQLLKSKAISSWNYLARENPRLTESCSSCFSISSRKAASSREP